MKTHKRIIRAGACLVVAVLLFLFFLPPLLPLRPLISRLVGQVETLPPERLSAGSCSLGWLDGLSCTDVRYQDPVRGLSLRVPRLTTDKGLLLTLLAPGYLGELHLEGPTLLVGPRPDGSLPAVGKDKAAAIARIPTSPPDTAADSAAPWWDKRTLRLKVEGARIILAEDKGGERELIRGLGGHASLSMGTIEFGVRLGDAGNQGTLQVGGFINLPPRRQPIPENLVARFEAEFSRFSLAEILDLAASRLAIPRGNGLLDGRLGGHFAGTKELDLQGEVTLVQAQFFGGLLGLDRPEIDRLGLRFQGSRHPVEGWRLSTLALSSAPIEFTASGRLAPNSVDLQARGEVDLPLLAAQVPHLLALHEKTAIREGEAGFTLKVQGAPERFSLSADCRTERLGWDHDGHPYLWETPLVVQGEAEVAAGRVLLHSLMARAPFFELSADGSREDFRLQATADLDRSFQELDRLFSLDVHGGGKARLSLSSRLEADGRYGLAGRLGIERFSLRRGQVSLFPGHPFSLAVQALGAPTFFEDYRLHDLRLSADSWPISLEIDARSPDRQPEPAQPNCTLKASVDLERLGVIRAGLADRPPVYTAKGMFHLDVAGSWTAERFAAGRLMGSIDHLELSRGGMVVKEPRLAFSLDPAELPAPRTMTVHRLRVADSWEDMIPPPASQLLVEGKERRLELTRLAFRGDKADGWASLTARSWGGADFAAAGELSVQGESAGLADLARLGGWLPAVTGPEGWAQTLIRGETDKQGNQLTAEITVTPFAWLERNTKIFADPRLQASMLLQSDPADPDSLILASLKLATEPLSLSGGGLIRLRPSPTLELQGLLTPDLAALMPRLRPLVGRQLDLEGRESGPFLLAAPLAWPIDPLALTFSWQLPVADLRFQSLHLERLIVPLDLNRGRMSASIEVPMDGGRLSLRPEWNLAGPSPSLSLPAASPMLQGVRVSRPLIDSLLCHVHPLLGALAQPIGTIDLRLDHLVWNLEAAKAGPDLALSVGLANLEFRPVRALADLFGLAGLSRQGLRLADEEMRCRSQGERMVCEPVHLVAGNQRIAVTGETGRDGTMLCRLVLPVQQQLANQALPGVPVLPDETVEAVIGGTRGKPFFDQQAFVVRLRDQLARAAAVPGAVRLVPMAADPPAPASPGGLTVEPADQHLNAPKDGG